MVAVWAVVFPASLGASWLLSQLPGPLNEMTLLRSAALTAILVLVMDILIIPRLEQTMSWLFPRG
jgi:antibiotic biosynthesis monooxygenase (ABM) superfamily enzyme